MKKGIGQTVAVGAAGIGSGDVATLPVAVVIGIEVTVVVEIGVGTLPMLVVERFELVVVMNAGISLTVVVKMGVHFHLQ